MRNILFIPIMACNLRCPVCHFTWNKDGSWDAYDHRGRWHDAMLDPTEWLAGLERFAPYHLELTGGEPSLYPGLAELLANLHEGCAWSITSNLLTEAALRLPLDRCASFTASWHGSPIADFLRRLEVITMGGRVPSVSVVARPGELHEVRRALRAFGPYYRVNVLRELNPGVDWSGKDAASWEQLEALAVDYGANLVTDDIPPSYQFSTHARCSAGSKDYFCAFPDGLVYRCYSDAFMRPDNVLGFIGSFDPLPRGYLCGLPCAGCAADHRAEKEEAA